MKSKSAVLWHCLALSLMFLAGCETGPPVIAIESPDAALSPMFVGTAAVFMKIINTGGDDTLTGAHTDIAGSVAELHDIKDGKMMRVDEIPIPADSTVLLRPARLHIMVFKLPKSLKEGDEFSLILSFTKSGEKAVRLRLAKFTASSGR